MVDDSAGDVQYMQQALELACGGLGWVSPNPLVGCVLVKDGAVVGRGYHQRFGGPHAEVHALQEAGPRARGAVLYVNLEPCSHTGKTPPCADAVLHAGVSRVVVALLRGSGVPMGYAVAVARIAGIAGAKRTPDLVPLCHPIALHGVTVDIEVTDDAVEITATARTADRTGVEMEALTSVAVAGLTMIDMVKAVDPRASITDVRLLAKSGGKSGEWTR